MTIYLWNKFIYSSRYAVGCVRRPAVPGAVGALDNDNAQSTLPLYAQINEICIQTLQSIPNVTEWGRAAVTIYPRDKFKYSSRQAVGCVRCRGLSGH